MWITLPRQVRSRAPSQTNLFRGKSRGKNRIKSANPLRRNGLLVGHPTLDVREVSSSSLLSSTILEKSELAPNREWVRISCVY